MSIFFAIQIASFVVVVAAIVATVVCNELDKRKVA